MITGDAGLPAVLMINVFMSTSDNCLYASPVFGIPAL